LNEANYVMDDLRLKSNVYQYQSGVRFRIGRSTVDYGLLSTIILPNLYFGAFWFLAMLKLDGVIEWSWFILLIPFWLFMLPMVILMILHGITSKAKSVSIVEKVIIAFLTPSGFLASLILCLLRLDGILDWNLVWLFIPNFVSVLAFYLYFRQLKALRIRHRTVPEKSESQGDEDSDY